MRPSGVILLLLALWLLLIAFVALHALLTGRIRIGWSGSEPVLRSEDPSGFWMAFTLSAGGLVAGGLVLGWILGKALPAPWAEAMRMLGW